MCIYNLEIHTKYASLLSKGNAMWYTRTSSSLALISAICFRSALACSLSSLQGDGCHKAWKLLALLQFWNYYTFNQDT